MKIYKYDNITMVAMSKQTRDKLLKIKQQYKLKNMDVVINKLIDEQEPYNECNN